MNITIANLTLALARSESENAMHRAEQQVRVSLISIYSLVLLVSPSMLRLFVYPHVPISSHELEAAFMAGYCVQHISYVLMMRAVHVFA